MEPTLVVDIARKALERVVQNEGENKDERAVIELRKQVARSVAELELIKSERREVSRKMFLVTPRLHKSPDFPDDPKDAA